MFRLRLLPRDPREKAEAALLHALCRMGLVIPKQFLLTGWVQSALEGWPGREDRGADATRLAHINAAVADRWPVRARCLQRSLVLAWLLRRRRIAGRMRIGVRKESDGIAAHAWVEVAGEPLGDLLHHCSEFLPLDMAHDALFRSGRGALS